MFLKVLAQKLSERLPAQVIIITDSECLDSSSFIISWNHIVGYVRILLQLEYCTVRNVCISFNVL